jgi:signal transduction histidine kinase
MNALKYGLQGPIEITVMESDGTTSISVRDEGEGIAADQLDRIFDPFVQLPTTDGTETKRKGVGLGLAISRDLARAMHGDLTVASEPGRGSTFTLRLPSG